jgi:hypothetical protein
MQVYVSDFKHSQLMILTEPVPLPAPFIFKPRLFQLPAPQIQIAMVFNVYAVQGSQLIILPGGTVTT